MRLFGFDIIRVKKRDIEQATILKKVVIALSDVISDAIGCAESINLDNYNQKITILLHQVQVITTLMLLYEENKFAKPFDAVRLVNLQNTISKEASTFRHMLMQYSTLQEKVQDVMIIRRQEYLESSDGDYMDMEWESEKINMTMHHMHSSLERKQARLIETLIKALSIVQYDIFRITIGVDIIRSCNDLKKMFPRGKAVYEFKMMHER